MSQLLINSISSISRLCGCLVYSSPTKVSVFSRILYPVNVVQTLQIAILFLYHFTSGAPLLSLDFKKYSVVLNLLELESKVIMVIKYVITFACQLMTLIGSWRHRYLVAKIMAEGKIILKTHRQGSALSWKDWYQILVYPMLLITRFGMLALTDFFQDSNSLSVIFVQCFILWARMTPICMEGQFAAVASIVETALIDINQRIEKFAGEDGDHYRGDCHLGENYLHPFFQYQEIIPSRPINTRSSLINFQLNKSSPNQGTTLAGYEQYSDSMGGLNCQLLPLREEIRNRGDAGVPDPFLYSRRTPGAPGAFKAIEEEKQPARNQFATESKPAPLHLLNLLRLRLSSKISPPKKDETREMKSIRITVGSKGRNSPAEKVEGHRKRCEMRELSKQHSRVARLAGDLSTSFETQLASTQLYVKVTCPLNLYLLVRYLKKASSLGETCCGNTLKIGTMIVYQLARIFTICERGESAILEGEKTRRNLLALSRGRLSPGLVQEVESFLTQVELSPIEFKAGLNTRVNMARFFSIVLNLVTSFIILTQFSGLS